MIRFLKPFGYLEEGRVIDSIIGYNRRVMGWVVDEYIDERGRLTEKKKEITYEYRFHINLWFIVIEFSIWRDVKIK